MNECQRPWSEETAPPFYTLISMREEAVNEQLAIYIQNLNRLEIEKAQYGLSVPTGVANEIEYTYGQIERCTREIQREAGILRWLDDLRNAYIPTRAFIVSPTQASSS